MKFLKAKSRKMKLLLGEISECETHTFSENEKCIIMTKMLLTMFKQNYVKNLNQWKISLKIFRFSIQ